MQTHRNRQVDNIDFCIGESEEKWKKNQIEWSGTFDIRVLVTLNIETLNTNVESVSPRREKERAKNTKTNKNMKLFCSQDHCMAKFLKRTVSFSQEYWCSIKTLHHRQQFVWIKLLWDSHIILCGHGKSTKIPSHMML